MAVANYHSAHGHSPPAYVVGPDGRAWHSWRVLVLPYIEESKLYAEYNFAEPWDGPHNRTLAERMPRTYRFHGSESGGNVTANYLAVVGEGTAWPGSATITDADVADNRGSTILLVENDGAGVHWMEPRDLPLGGFDSRVGSPRGVSAPYDRPAVVMLDGSLHALGESIRPDALSALVTIRGGERVAHAEAGREVLRDGRDRPAR